MHLVTGTATGTPAANLTVDAAPAALETRYAQYKVIRRNGAVVGFEPAKISIAMTKAFLAVNGGQSAASARVREQVTNLTESVVAALLKRKPEGGAIHIEEIQDQVELALMRGGRPNGVPELETPEFMMSKLEEFGGEGSYGHYAVGWAWAMNSPYQWTKQVASHFGGTRNGVAMSWPARTARAWSAACANASIATASACARSPLRGSSMWTAC